MPSLDWDPLEGIPEEAQRQGQEIPEHNAANYPSYKFTNPHQFRAVVRNITRMYDVGSPEEHEQGRLWYPKVHEAVAKGVRRTSLTPWQGAGLVAAVSPAMDWEKRNIHALREMQGLKERDWQTIEQSARSGLQGPKHRRTPEAADVLKGLSISSATDYGLHRAHRIMQGEQPEEVMPKHDTPKMFSFASSIHDPTQREHVPIDYRAHDIGQNKMYPTDYSGRGISSADLPSSKIQFTKSGKPAKRYGQKTRYEHFEEGYRQAALARETLPTEMQASTWVTGKRIERSAPTQSGEARKVGVHRLGQPYL